MSLFHKNWHHKATFCITISYIVALHPTMLLRAWSRTSVHILDFPTKGQPMGCSLSLLQIQTWTPGFHPTTASHGRQEKRAESFPAPPRLRVLSTAVPAAAARFVEFRSLAVRKTWRRAPATRARGGDSGGAFAGLKRVTITTRL